MPEQNNREPAAPVYEPGFFAEFDQPTLAQWKEEAERTLKGAPLDKKTLTKTYEGITLKALYTDEDLKGLLHMGSLPGFAPYVRGARAQGNLKPWLVAQEVTRSTPESCNRVAREELSKGSTALNLGLDMPTSQGLDPDQAAEGMVGRGGLSLCTLQDMETALKGIDLTAQPLLVHAGACALPVAAMILALGKGLPQGVIGADPLGELAQNSELPLTYDQALDAMAGLAKWAALNADELRTVIASSRPYHEAGASAVQELAFVLATAVEYVRGLTEAGMSAEDACCQLVFVMPVGANFFMEIAKLRALRALWAQAADAFGARPHGGRALIHARTSSYTKTVYDPYVNLLRNTTEAFAAACGGAGSLHVTHFDEAMRPADEFSRRVSRNLQIVLQKESHLTIPIDPGGGSWYLETLTHQLGRAAWELFQEIEGMGGMAQALEDGKPQQACAETAKARARNLGTRKDRVVGTNQYVNLAEVKLTPDGTDYAAIAKQRIEQTKSARVKVAEYDPADPGSVVAAAKAFKKGASLNSVARAGGMGSGGGKKVTPLVRHRAALDYENLRSAMEAHKAKTGSAVPIFLANLGPIPQHKPRADFSTGFFSVGGFEMLSNTGFDTPEAAAEAALASGANIMVICSSDAAYPEAVPAFCKAVKAVKPEAYIILAGYPAKEHAGAYTGAGLDDFIFIKSDCYQMLKMLQEREGVGHA